MNVAVCLFFCVYVTPCLSPAQDLSDADKRAFYPDEKRWCVQEIKKHVRADKKLVLENVRSDGRSVRM